MIINSNGFTGYLRPRIEKIKSQKQGIVTADAVVFEKDSEGKNSSKDFKDSDEQEEEEEEELTSKKKDSSLINVVA